MDPAGKGVRDRRPGFNHWLLTLQVSQNDPVLRFHPSRCRRCGQDRQFTQLPDLGSPSCGCCRASPPAAALQPKSGSWVVAWAPRIGGTCRMKAEEQSIVTHLMGEQPMAEACSAIADTFAGRVH